MQQEIIETKQFFESHNIRLSDEWLEGCINWFHEEIGDARYTKTELHTKVYEQWLLLDLRDVDVSQLPANITNEKKIVLNNSFCLQMMAVVDISKSKFSQLQKIKNLNSLTRGFDDEKEPEPVSKRVLQLTLTDGLQEIKAIEYKPVPVLNINLTPGMKIKINGPVIVRRGQLMLEQHNVKLLGGEVEEILISHAAENVLARYLNLPENPKPNTVDETSLLEETINKNNIASTNNNIIHNSRPLHQNIKQNLITNYTNINSNTISTVRNDISEEEERRIAAEVEMLLEAEEDIFEEDTRGSISHNKLKVINCGNETLLQVKKNADRNPIQNRTSVDDSRIEAEIETLLETERELLEANTSNLQTLGTFEDNNVNELTKSSTNNDELNCSLEMGDELFTSLEMDKHLDKIEEKYHTLQKITLREVLDNIQNNRYGKFKVHAKFKSVLQKITLKDDKWILQICVTDNQHEIAVYMHSNVVSEMTGFTPQEAMNMKHHIESKNVGAVETIMKALGRVKDKLVELDCLMEIEYTKAADSPIITKLL